MKTSYNPTQHFELAMESHQEALQLSGLLTMTSLLGFRDAVLERFDSGVIAPTFPNLATNQARLSHILFPSLSPFLLDKSNAISGMNCVNYIVMICLLSKQGLLSDISEVIPGYLEHTADTRSHAVGKLKKTDGSIVFTDLRTDGIRVVPFDGNRLSGNYKPERSCLNPADWLIRNYISSSVHPRRMQQRLCESTRNYTLLRPWRSVGF
ncbi:MAG: hypothetical protein ACOCXT_02315 [Candidatus Dojkabacteria bacterium]